jgi:hypothetical protein
LDLSKGPFCYGDEKIGFVDIMIAPFMIRNPVLETYKNFKIKEILLGDDLEKYIRWETAILTDKSVKPTLASDQKMIKVSFLLVLKTT